MGQFEVEGVVRVIGEEVLVLRNLFSGNDLVCLRLSGRYDCAFRLFASSERGAHDDGGSALVAALVVLEAALVELQIRELVPASAVRDVSAVRLASVLAVVAACVGSPRRLGLGGHRHRRGQRIPTLFCSVCHSVWRRSGAARAVRAVSNDLQERLARSGSLLSPCDPLTARLALRWMLAGRARCLARAAHAGSARTASRRVLPPAAAFSNPFSGATGAPNSIRAQLLARDALAALWLPRTLPKRSPHALPCRTAATSAPARQNLMAAKVQVRRIRGATASILCSG